MGYLRYVLKRLLQLPITVLGTISIIFLILRMVGSDPAVAYVGEGAVSKEGLEAFRKMAGLDLPLHEQYLFTVMRLFTFDLGRSWSSNRLVISEIREVLPYTLQLAGFAIVFGAIIGTLAGLISAQRVGQKTDYVVMGIGSLGISMPLFWLGLLLILLFAHYLGWFPVASVTVGADMLSQLRALILPGVTIGVYVIALNARFCRSSALEVIGADFIRAVRAKGATPARLLYGHVLRNALIPVITVNGLYFGSLLSGAAAIEAVFARPGIGTMFIAAVSNRNFPVIEGLIFVFSILFVSLNVVVDIIYSFVDPRIRYS